jgi:ABC-type phosphate transport system substrate-binding protein
VAAFVNRLPNSIGYVEYAYVKQNKMTYAQLKNKDGAFVAQTTRTSRPPQPAPTGTRASTRC